MWFLIGSGLVLVLIMVAALVSDVRRRAQLRRVARRGRAGIDVRGGHASGAQNHGTLDLGS